MAKNNKQAAKKANEKENVKNVEAKKPETKKTQEAAPASKTTDNPAAKPAKKAPEAPPAFKQEPEKKKTTVSISVGNVTDLLDPNKRRAHTPDASVQLLDLADRRFSRPDAETRLSREFLDNMNMIIDAGVACEIADEAMFGDGSFTRVMKSSMLPKFRVLAEQMGIKIPEMKALEAITTAEELEKGNVVVKTDKKNISKETKEQLQKEHDVRDQIPELDPVKVFAAGEEALKDALRYKLISKKGMGEVLVNIVDFMREYRAEEARHAENTAEAMKKFDDRTVGQWLDDAFTVVTPTVLFRGIGRGLCATTSLSKSPVQAFLILKNAIKKGTGSDVWDDQSIANATATIIRWIAQDEIERNKKDIALLDPKHAQYAETKEKYENSVKHYEKILKSAMNPDYELVESITEPDPEKVTEAVKSARKMLQSSYYPDVKEDTYVNMLSNLQQYAGYITGLFREPGTADANYSLGNVQELKTLSAEEKQEEESKKD